MNPNADAEAKVLTTGVVMVVVMNLCYSSKTITYVLLLWGVVVGWRTALLRKGQCFSYI